MRLKSLKLKHCSSYTVSHYLLVHMRKAVMIVETLLGSLLERSGDKMYAVFLIGTMLSDPF